MDRSAIQPPATVYPNVQAIHNGQSRYSCGQPGHRQCDCPMGSHPWRQGGAVLDLIQGELPTLVGHSLAERVWAALEQLHVYELAATAAQNTAAGRQTDPRGGGPGLPAAYGADLG